MKLARHQCSSFKQKCHDKKKKKIRYNWKEYLLFFIHNIFISCIKIITFFSMIYIHPLYQQGVYFMHYVVKHDLLSLWLRCMCFHRHNCAGQVFLSTKVVSRSCTACESLSRGLPTVRAYVFAKCDISRKSQKKGENYFVNRRSIFISRPAYK